MLYVQGLKLMQLYVGSRKGDPPASEVSDVVTPWSLALLCHSVPCIMEGLNLEASMCLPFGFWL